MLPSAKPPFRTLDRSRLGRSELEAVLEIAEAATGELELEALLRVVVDKIAQVIQVDRCSAILVDAESDRALVMASHDVPELRRLPIELDRYPELRQAIESRSSVVIEDALTDPLMAGVRPLLAAKDVASLVVAPLVAQGDAYGALFLRLARNRAFGPDEQAFVRVVASTVAASVRNARLHTSVRQKRDELEAAYEQRYQELCQLNEQLREANRIKDELLAVCSHDVRAPLNVLLGHTRILLGIDPAPRQRASLEVIERQGQRVLQLVEGILDKGRGRAGTELTFRPVDLAACAAQVAADLSALGTSKEVGVRTAAEGTVEAEVDESAVRQILENLVGNAMAHAPPGSTVEVVVAPDETLHDRCRIEVLDRGPGIPPDQMPLIFERYRKGSSGSGLGLGLAISRELVELHGGDIWVKPRPGGGTCFAVALPQRPLSSTSSVAKQGRVLVVEPDSTARGSLGAALARSSQVSYASSTAEGLVRARAILPHEIVLGPGLEPAEVADFSRELRSQPGLGEITVLQLQPDGQGVAPDHRAAAALARARQR